MFNASITALAQIF